MAAVRIDKAWLLKSVRNIAISVAVLLVVVVGSGIAYTWYVGQNAAVDSPIAAPMEPAPPKVIKPTKPAADAKQSAAVQMLTSPVAPGENASIMVKTNAESDCTISVKYNEIASTDSGLKPKKADDFGIVSWAWTVEPTVPVGKWPVDVICAFNEQSAMVRGDLVVENKK
ncbi:MAG: exported protein of unknown function [Candidatus Saccharibacteria bacterium]|nr:exported protein of unknown function [Candidatus Saccharibacteria bacterium]